jgi:hypothetical protein
MDYTRMNGERSNYLLKEGESVQWYQNLSLYCLNPSDSFTFFSQGLMNASSINVS